MLAKTERWITDYIRGHENIEERPFLEAATKALGRSPRSVRGYLARLDGVSIKRVREGRKARLQTIDYWRRHEHQTFDLRVPHAGKLKPVLDLFRSQVPIVQDRALQTEFGVEYRPDMLLEFERHVLFDDLLFHLDLLSLQASPSVAWPEFKKGASRFIAARDALWTYCIKTARTALRLPLGGAWKGEELSEHCVALFYWHALAAARNETEREDVFVDAKVVPMGDTMEYWLSGRGILRRRSKNPADLAEMAKKVTAELKRALKRVEGPGSLDLAHSVVDSLNELLAIRGGLVSALEEASYYEVFPGACRFTEPA